MSNEDPACEQRIDAELSERLDDYHIPDDNDEEWQAPEPLSIERQITYHVALSTGGPADGFRLTFDPESGLLIRGEYYFQDWFDGATRTLSDDDADMIAEAYGIYVEPEERRPRW